MWPNRRDVAEMVPLLTISLLFAAPVPESNPDVLLLFANEAAYQKSPALEARYEGRLEFQPPTGTMSSRFRLLVPEGDGEIHPYELHLPRAVTELAPFVGQTVRILGKNTDVGLWPGKLERVRQTGGPDRDGLIARSPWQPASARRISRQVQTFVIRSGEQAAPLFQVTGSGSGAAATRLLARELRQPEIDWDKAMIVCVSAGLKTDVERLSLTRAVVKDGALTVYYRMIRPTNEMSSGFGYPAETGLLPRFDGPIRFVEEVGQ